MIVIDNITDVERHLDGIKAVIFDLDDTLYPEKEYVRCGYQKIAEHFGKPELANELWEVFIQGRKAIDEVFEAHGMTGLKQEALRIYRFQNPEIHLYEGVAEMLTRLQQSYKIGIITDGRPEGQHAKIEALKLTVHELIVTDEIGGIEYRKPNPTAFVLMQKRLNIPFGEMIYVGDNLKKDFHAPRELGMAYIWYKNNDGLYKNNLT